VNKPIREKGPGKTKPICLLKDGPLNKRVFPLSFRSEEGRTLRSGEGPDVCRGLSGQQGRRKGKKRTVVRVKGGSVRNAKGEGKKKKEKKKNNIRPRVRNKKKGKTKKRQHLNSFSLQRKPSPAFQKKRKGANLSFTEKKRKKLG